MNNQHLIQIVCPSCFTPNRVPSEKLSHQPMCGKCKNTLLVGEPMIANDQNFSRIVNKSDLPVVVDFWAPWCGPCKAFAPTFAQVASEMSMGASFVKLDTQDNQHVAASYQIRSIPTLMVFKQGREVGRLSGALPKQQFVEWLKHYL